MDIRKIYDIFGGCYNKRDFGEIGDMLDDHVVYESHDCLYKVESVENVIKVLNESIRDGSSAYSGYFMKNGMFIKRLTHCVVICNDSTLECTRLIYVKMKKGKIITITGYDPKEYDFTRGKKIDDFERG